MYSFGDIVIINFPFSDGQGAKRRPVMLIKDTADQDLLIAKITSQLYRTQFDVTLQDWKQSNLLSPSVVRVHKIQTVYEELVFGQIGRLSEKDLQEVRNAFSNLLNSL